MYDSARLSDKLMRGLGFESGYAVQVRPISLKCMLYELY